MKGSLSRVAPKEPFWLLFPKNSQIEMAQNSIPASMVPSRAVCALISLGGPTGRGLDWGGLSGIVTFACCHFDVRECRCKCMPTRDPTATTA